MTLRALIVVAAALFLAAPRTAAAADGPLRAVVNGGGKTGFRATDGVPALPTTIRFTTRAK